MEKGTDSAGRGQRELLLRLRRSAASTPAHRRARLTRSHPGPPAASPRLPGHPRPSGWPCLSGTQAVRRGHLPARAACPVAGEEQAESWPVAQGRRLALTPESPSHHGSPDSSEHVLPFSCCSRFPMQTCSLRSTPGWPPPAPAPAQLRALCPLSAWERPMTGLVASGPAKPGAEQSPGSGKLLPSAPCSPGTCQADQSHS